jgi:tetratricopeptide (TPR) repeat protein
VRTFFLFIILNSLLGSPVLAILVILAMAWFAEAQWTGRYFNPASWMKGRSELTDLQHKVAINPHDVGAHNDIGRILVRKGKASQGLEHLRKAIVRMDDSAETQYWLGLALMETGETQEGERHIRQALVIDPRHAYGEPWVQLSRRLLDDSRAEDAAETARQATSINTSSVEGWGLLGRAEKALGNHEAAATAFAQAAETYDHLPRYLRLASRPFAREAKREARR